MEHDCLDHLVMRGGYDIEPHGESHYDTWNECSICHATYSDDEVAEMWEQQEVVYGQ